MDITNEEREKAKAAAMKILEQFQNDGLTDKEVKLIVFWLKPLSDEIIEKNQAKNKFFLSEI